MRYEPTPQSELQSPAVKRSGDKVSCYKFRVGMRDTKGRKGKRKGTFSFLVRVTYLAEAEAVGLQTQPYRQTSLTVMA
jgi:hypothetical protein